MRAARTEPLLRLSPDVPDLAALGAQRLEDLAGEGAPLATEPRARALAGAASRVEWRLPLPGTLDDEGRMHESPRGAGTGWVRLVRYPAGARRGLRERWRERFGHPRSSSPAAREWNLACHLQARGVATPALMAMGETAAGSSFLVTRELEGFVTLDEWLASAAGERELRLGTRALGHAFARLFRSGIWLPRLDGGGVWIEAAHGRGSGADCAAIEIEHLRARTAHLARGGLRRVELPAVAFSGLEGGRLPSRLGPRRRRAMLEAAGGAAPPGVCARVAALAR